MKQKLNGRDRLLIPQLLPTESGMLEQLTIKEIIDIVAIRSEEFDDYGLVEKEEKCPHCGYDVPNGSFIWTTLEKVWRKIKGDKQ